MIKIPGINLAKAVPVNCFLLYILDKCYLNKDSESKLILSVFNFFKVAVADKTIVAMTA